MSEELETVSESNETDSPAEDNVQQKSNIPDEIFKEAESQGWVPKERFRGNETDWVDADVFVKRGREILPILRKNNENLLKDLNATKEQLKEFRETAEEFKRFQKESYERKAAEYEAKIRELRESRAQAITDGDGQRVNALDDALDVVKEEFKEAKEAAENTIETPVAQQPVANTIDPVLQSWLDKNTWFGQDRRMTSIVNGIGESLRVDFPMLKGQEFLEKLDEILIEEFPSKFGAKKKLSGSTVESGSGRQSRASTSVNAKSYENLPPDAKAACDRFVKQKLMTKEQYVAEYDWN